jgi:Mg2+ and Co2+ transporter CorA
MGVALNGTQPIMSQPIMHSRELVEVSGKLLLRREWLWYQHKHGARFSQLASNMGLSPERVRQLIIQEQRERMRMWRRGVVPVLFREVTKNPKYPESAVIAFVERRPACLVRI